MSTYRVKHRVIVLSTVDTDEKLIEFQRQDEVTTTVTRTDLTKGLTQTRAIPFTTVDEALSLGDVGTAKVLYLETDQELTLKLNGGTESFKLTPTSGSRAKLFWEGEFTAIEVSNASTDTDATISYMIAG